MSRDVLVWSHSKYLKIQVFIKIGFMRHDAQLMICHPNLYMFRLFWREVLWSQLEANKDHQIGRRLLPGSIPTLLPHKKDNKPHLSSEKRALAQRKEEGIYCFNKVISKVSSLKLQTLRLLLYWKKKSRHSFFSRILSKFQKFWNLTNI